MAAPIFNLVTGTATAKVAQRFAKLTFVFTVTGTIVAATALAAVAAASISVNRTSRSGTDQVILPVNLLDILEMATLLQGAIIVSNDGVNVTTIEATLEFAELLGGGSLQPKENEVFEITLSNIPAGTTATVELLELKGVASKRYAYDIVGVLANAPTPVDVSKAKKLALRVANLVSVEFHYPDGSIVLYSPENCHSLVTDYKQIAYIKNGLVTAGHERVFTLAVDQVSLAVVTYNAAANVIVMKEVLI